MRGWTGAFVVVLLSGCARSAHLSTVAPQPMIQGTAQPGVVRSGALLEAQLQQPLSTATSRPGDRFTLELLAPVIDTDGQARIGRGALIEGEVAALERSSMAGDPARISLRLEGVRTQREGLVSMPIQVASGPVGFRPTWRRDAIVGLAGLGAGIGTGLAIDHDSSGLVLGSALLGAGVGLLGSLLFWPREAEIPAGSVMTLRVAEDWRPTPEPETSTLAPCPVK